MATTAQPAPRPRLKEWLNERLGLQGLAYAVPEHANSLPYILGGITLTGFVILLITGILFYLPFYLGFSSQAGGILPSLVYVTSGVHLWVMFAPLLMPLFAFLLYRWSRRSGPWRWQGFAFAGGLVLILWVLMLALSTAISLVPGVGNLFLNNLAAPGLGALIGQSIPAGDRWYQVFQRYLGVVAGRVDALGGDSTRIGPSPSGDWRAALRCEAWAHARVIVLAALVVSLGFFAGASLALAAVLAAAALGTWVSWCHPTLCQLARACVGGLGLGGALLGLLVLLEFAAPQGVAVLATVAVLLALTILFGRLRKCW